MDLIRRDAPIRIQIGKQPNEKVHVANPAEFAIQMEKVWDGADLATPEQVKQIADMKIPLTDGREIGFQNIFKSPAIKGKDADYNVGDIGEISLGISAAARFAKAGAAITFDDYMTIATALAIGPIPGKKSMKGEWRGRVNNADDTVELLIALPARSMKAFKAFMRDFEAAPNNVRGTVMSSLKWANENKNIEIGLAKTKATKEPSNITISADGVGDQKGTKADLFLSINGEHYNLISAKAGASQLGQASGVEFNNISTFFNAVFGINIDKYQKSWTDDNELNLEVLRKIYSSDVIPLVTRLVAGDDNRKEAELVRQIGNGLVHYANDIRNGKPDVVDIVKLMTTPTKPGYKLMRIGPDLVNAMEQVNLYGKPTPNGLGIAVYGDIKGQATLLFRVRSYYSPAANLTRTIIEGGGLLDKLASVVALEQQNNQTD